MGRWAQDKFLKNIFEEGYRRSKSIGMEEDHRLDFADVGRGSVGMERLHRLDQLR